MFPAFDILCLVITSIMNVIGIVNSAFIVAVNFLDWAKGRTLGTCDLILLTDGIAVICYQSTLVGHNYFSRIWWEVYIPGCNITFLCLLLLWTEFSTCWLTTCLCVFYCVKIVDFNHAFFFWMKLRISKVMPWLLLGTVLGSLALSVPIFWDLYGQSQQNSTSNLVFNSTNTDARIKSITSYVLGNILGCCLPILLNIISILLILTSLIRHTRRMKESASGFSQPRLESHFDAAKIMGSLLLLYFLLILAECCFILSPSQWWLFVLGMILTAFGPAQSTVLILGNSKLKQALCSIFSPCSK